MVEVSRGGLLPGLWIAVFSLFPLLAFPTFTLCGHVWAWWGESPSSIAITPVRVGHYIMALLNLLSLFKALAPSAVPWHLGLGLQHGSFEGLQHICSRNFFVKVSVNPYISAGFAVVCLFLLWPNSSQKATERRKGSSWLTVLRDTARHSGGGKGTAAWSGWRSHASSVQK